MGRRNRVLQSICLLALLAAPVVNSQATSSDDLPNLSTVTEPTNTGDTTTATTAESTESSQSAASTTRGTSVVGVITDAPDIGASIPTLIIPDTANAPFMQKSDLPEGTFFITVGAVLAFLGACVLLWRGLVAWSVNRSVKRAATASLRSGTEKISTAWTPSGYTHLGKGMYNDYDGGSSMSLDALTSSGKNVKDHHHRNNSTVQPPANLFFSPTAHAQTARTSSPAFDNTPVRAGDRSSYLPAGYYASPSADRPAGGAGNTTIGGSSLAPYARNSGVTPSPPRSPDLPPTSRSTATYYQRSSREGLRSSDGLRASTSRDALSRDGYGPVVPRHSALYAQPSNSSLMVGVNARQSSEQLGGSRAPSAYMEDLFQNHGHGPRERF